MWIKQLLASRSGCPVGSHAWILIAMFQLAMDFTICESVAQGQGFRLLQRPSHWHRLSHSPLWSFKNGQQLRIPGPFWNHVSSHPERSHGQIQTYHSKRPHKATDQLAGFYKSMQSKHSATAKPAPSVVDGSSRGTDQQTPLKRGKRHLRGSNFDHRDRRPTTVPEVIVWGPTGEEDSMETSTFPGNYGTTTTSALQTRTTTVATTTTTTSTTVRSKGFTASPVPGLNKHKNNPGRISTTEPYTSHKSNGKEARPPKLMGDTTGLAVHQIITITVSLIMVIAALITTLVLKNCRCLFQFEKSMETVQIGIMDGRLDVHKGPKRSLVCVQSGNTRRNGHQRKINQQEESCQNLTDFTPARVPSNLDIFTAYNETLQCSHECVRTPMPVYTEEMLHSPGDYKTTFNGNRPSSSDRHLIPVAFVSEKWFEISC
ncbi:adherens junction-associated protein 1 isoform X2 [Caretta caretta]|uniref:adherens junction-associated protein 1 isoform X2 n=1 Tax=Caretta caretta TaxID=8467 RepID=UPI003F4B2443